MVQIGCISRSQGQKLGFQNAIFKNLLVWNYKAQSFHNWCIISSRGPLPIFGGQHKWSSVNGSTVIFDLFLRWATKGPLGPLVGIYHHLEVLYQSFSNYAPGVKIDLGPGVTILHWILLGKNQTTPSLEPLMGIWPNTAGIIPGRPPTKIVQMVMIGCISRSLGQKQVFKMQFSKVFLSKTARPRAFIFDV